MFHVMNLDYSLLRSSKLEEIPKPGWQAQMKMAPQIRKVLPKDFVVPADARQAAVLFLLYPDHNALMHFCLIQRPRYAGQHSGQISFPGGKQEQYDADFWATALRETKEEVGIREDQIEFLTSLTPTYIPPSNFVVRPFMAVAPSPLLFSPDNKEVDHIIEVPLNALLSPSNLHARSVKTSYMEEEVPMFVFDNYEVWGATAMILSEAKELILSLPDFRIE